VLALALLAYAAVAADVVEHGRLSAFDQDMSRWIARSMPVWAEWLARALSWVGGAAGVAVLVALVAAWLVRRGWRMEAAVLVAAAAGSQLLSTLAKEGYDRPRPTAGSPIALPSSSSFPSGHATTGIAVFGLLGLLLAARLSSRAARLAAIAAGFAVGSLIGASRVVLDVHFLTDVVAGAALGLAWLAVCLLAVHVARRRHR
jgi:undecaprenyl-diphosphatase